MKTLRLTTIAAALVLAYGGHASAANLIQFDPDGAGGSDPTLSVKAFDWAPGAVLSVPTGYRATGTFGPGGVVTGYQAVSGQTASNPQVGDILTNYLQGTMIGLLNSNNQQITGTGLGSAYELTFVLGYQEYVDTVSGNVGLGSASFKALNPNFLGPDNVNFFEVYYDSPINSNQLAGRNFNDGTLILSGNITGYTSAGGTGFTSFTATGFNNPVDHLDSSGQNNFSGITTVSGTGNAKLQVKTTYQNASFFPDTINTISSMVFNTVLSLAFDSTDPSSCFWDGSAYISGAGPYNNAPVGTPAGCSTNTLGTINAFNGVNLEVQSDANQTFTSVPEIDALTGTGALTLLAGGLALASERNRRRAAR